MPSAVTPSCRAAFLASCVLLTMAVPVSAAGVTPCSTADPSSRMPKVRLASAFSGFIMPVGIFHAGDGSLRQFIVEQRGVIKLQRPARPGFTTFLDIVGRVTSGGELGLLGLAFHPNFADNGRLFVNYTSSQGGRHTVISEFRVGETPDEVDPRTERILLTIPQPYKNHNGGDLAFGPDGLLYIALGDGGSKNDPHGNAQNLSTLLGKILRIDVDRRDPKLPYGLPPDNPFVGRAGAAPEIWAYGLRNPWRFSFDAVTGWLFAGDVGQGAREEIDLIRKGGNYGWNVMEGTICTPGVNPGCAPEGFEPPLLDYRRKEGTTVIGGRVYRGTAIPALCGVYVYGDFGSGRIWGFRYDGNTVTGQKQLLKTGRRISAFGEDEQRELYVVDYEGEILKVIP